MMLLERAVLAVEGVGMIRSLAREEMDIVTYAARALYICVKLGFRKRSYFEHYKSKVTTLNNVKLLLHRLPLPSNSTPHQPKQV